MSEESKQSLFERFAKLIVPIVATVGVFFQQKQRAVALGLVAVALISLLAGEGPKLWRWFKERSARKHEERIAAQALDDMKSWIQKFLEFSTVSTTDSFYGIVWGRLCGSNIDHFESLHIPPLQLFADFARILAWRTDERKANRTVLKQTIEELNSLVGLYCTFCVCPIYERVPTKLKPEVLKNCATEKLEEALIQFRERYDRFLEDYRSFLKGLDRKLPDPIEPRSFGYHFNRPKPLAPSPKTEAVV